MDFSVKSQPIHAIIAAMIIYNMAAIYIKLVTPRLLHRYAKLLL